MSLKVLGERTFLSAYTWRTGMSSFVSFVFESAAAMTVSHSVETRPSMYPSRIEIDSW